MSVLCYMALCSGLTGQEAIYSDPGAMAVLRNPAQAGQFLGSIRISGAYHSQWNSANTGIYTASVAVDGPFPINQGQDWIGLGVHVLQDEIGTLNLRNTELVGYAAYHKALDSYRDHVLSAGVGVGFGQRSLVTLNNAVYLDELEQLVEISPDRANLIFGKRSFLELSVGLRIDSRLSEVLHVQMDLSSRHINRPDISLFQGEKYEASLFYRGQFGFHIFPERNLQFLTDYQFLKLDQTSQHRGGVIVRKILGFRADTHLDVGGGVHGGASWYGVIGGQIDNNFLRIVYDRSRFYFNNNQAYALEISGYHIFRLRHKPRIKPTIFCPRF